MRSRLMSPDPRRKPAALLKVGAAVIVVAANAPNSARRVMPDELKSVIYLAPVPSLTCFPPVRAVLPSHPQMQLLYDISRIGYQGVKCHTPEDQQFSARFCAKTSQTCLKQQFHDAVVPQQQVG